MGVLKKLVLVVALVVVGFVLFRLFIVGEPEILGAEALERIGAKSEVHIVVKGPERISGVRVEIGQDGRWVQIHEDARPERSKDFTVTVEPRILGLRDGSALVRIHAQGGWFRTTMREVATLIDTVPPVLTLIDATRWVKQGGAGAVHLRAQGAREVEIDAGSGGRYPCRRLNDGGEEWFGLFGIPVSGDPPASLRAIARDESGNSSSAILPSSVRAGNYPKQTIHLSDGFLEGKVRPMLGPEAEGLDPVGVFRRVNEAWRNDDETTLRALGAGAPSGLLWDGAIFSRLRNGKSMARYGDIRRYYYGNEQVSTSLHLGYDLASVRHAEVPAAASGSVVFRGPLKIYGNTIVLDHGLGLMTLYSHLSEFLVSEGDIVVRGTPVARTGSTGFAFGDHLHFGVLIHGLEVNPLEWWDAGWIEQNLAGILGPAFPAAPVPGEG